MNKEILLVNICKEKLGYYEFVKPIEDILNKNKIKFFVRPYKTLSDKDLSKSTKIIICGTTIFDNEFFHDIKKFYWIKKYRKPILGICGGMHLIGMIFGAQLKRKTEIGYFEEEFRRNFFGLEGNNKVYHLHNYYIGFEKIKDFDVYSGYIVSQAVKHKKMPIFGVLFHPEVRQKELIVSFCKNRFFIKENL